MEIKVFKDVSKRESMIGGLTPAQWLLIGGLVLFIVVDVLNGLYQFLPILLIRMLLFMIVTVLAVNALYRPHGLKFSTWIRLYITYQTTIQIRLYKKENKKVKIYDGTDFKASKKVKETIS